MVSGNWIRPFHFTLPRFNTVVLVVPCRTYSFFTTIFRIVVLVQGHLSPSLPRADLSSPVGRRGRPKDHFCWLAAEAASAPCWGDHRHHSTRRLRHVWPAVPHAISHSKHQQGLAVQTCKPTRLAWKQSRTATPDPSMEVSADKSRPLLAWRK